MKDKFFLNIEILNDKLLKFKIKYLYTSGHMWSQCGHSVVTCGHMWSQCGHMWSQYGHSVVTVWSSVLATIFFGSLEVWSLWNSPLIKL